MSRDAVRRYSQVYRSDPRALPPILLGTTRAGAAPFVIDGFHRLEAAQVARLSALPAEIRVVSRTEAKWLAVEANFKHGVPLSSRDKQQLFRRFVQAERHVKSDGTLMSSRELSRALPVGSHQAMLNWMKTDFPAIHAVMTGEDEDEAGGADDTNFEEEYAIESIEWAERQYLAAIRKAVDQASKEAIASAVVDIEERVLKAFGVSDLVGLVPVNDPHSDF